MKIKLFFAILSLWRAQMKKINFKINTNDIIEFINKNTIFPNWNGTIVNPTDKDDRIIIHDNLLEFFTTSKLPFTIVFDVHGTEIFLDVIVNNTQFQTLDTITNTFGKPCRHTTTVLDEPWQKFLKKKYVNYDKYINNMYKQNIKKNINIRKSILKKHKALNRPIKKHKLKTTNFDSMERY